MFEFTPCLKLSPLDVTTEYTNYDPTREENDCVWEECPEADMPKRTLHYKKNFEGECFVKHRFLWDGKLYNKMFQGINDLLEEVYLMCCASKCNATIGMVKIVDDDGNPVVDEYCGVPCDEIFEERFVTIEMPYELCEYNRYREEDMSEYEID